MLSIFFHLLFSVGVHAHVCEQQCNVIGASLVLNIEVLKAFIKSFPIKMRPSQGLTKVEFKNLGKKAKGKCRH